MRTSTTNDEVYLSILASRAVTGLAQLAEHPDQWPVNIPESDLQKGVAFCESVAGQSDIAAADIQEPLAQILHRLTAEMSTVRPNVNVSQEQIRYTEEFLKGLLARQNQPSLEDITNAINFFFTATSGYAIRQKRGEELF